MSFPDDTFLEEARSAMTEWEQRKKEMQERKDAVKKEYLQVVSTGRNGTDLSMVHTAQALRDAVENEEYDSVLNILDKATLPTGHTLGIEPCNMEGDSLGDTSKTFVWMPDGNRDKSIFEFFRFEDSCSGAWQAFLLHQMWHYLPLWWHANYESRHYHYSQEDAPIFTNPLPSFGKKVEMISPDFSQFDLIPGVYHSDEKYYISSCFWTSFGGLIREYAELTFKEGMLKGFFVFDEKTLVEYDCGILF